METVTLYRPVGPEELEFSPVETLCVSAGRWIHAGLPPCIDLDQQVGADGKSAGDIEFHVS